MVIDAFNQPDRHIMRIAVMMFSTIVLAACGTAPAARPQSSAQRADENAAVSYLLTSAANDFHSHSTPDPVGFRAVRTGYVATSTGDRQYMLCGEVLQKLPSGASAWTPFTTIKTSHYEQWIGDQAANFCKRPSITWSAENLSASLQSDFDALR